MTEKTLQKMVEREQFKNIGDEDNYRLSRNRVNDLIDETESEYYTTLAIKKGMGLFTASCS